MESIPLMLTIPNQSPNQSNGYEDREYQSVGTNFLRTIRRGFLTDEPGLGKTPQSIKAAELPCMVVAPRYLCRQWEEAIRREHEDAVIAFADGTRKQREKILSTAADWYIVNLEMLNTYDLPSGINTYINDESHHLRNRNAYQSKAAFIVENGDKSSRIYNLTATPFWKSVDDIWMQCHILYPQVFTSYHDFVKTYCVTLRTPYGVPKVASIKRSMREGLRDLLKPFMLGRTYKDVGRFLPEVVESVIKLDLSPVLRQMYDKVILEYSLKWQDEEEQRKLIFSPTTVLHVLRQITAQVGKFDAVEALIEDNFEKPAVIGFWYKDHARMMQTRLGEDKAVLITGDLDPIERQRRAMWAQNNGKHIVASQMSLSEGVNLYQYRMFIFAEQNYVPGSNHQFLSRVVRDRNDGGRDREPVRVFYIQARRTIDEDIYKVSRSRRTAIQATRELLQLALRK